MPAVEMISNGVGYTRDVGGDKFEVLGSGKKPNFTQTALHSRGPRAARVKCEDTVFVVAL